MNNEIENRRAELRGAFAELATEQAILAAAQEGVEEAASHVGSASWRLLCEIRRTLLNGEWESVEQAERYENVTDAESLLALLATERRAERSMQ